jgi:hypothetical protein
MFMLEGASHHAMGTGTPEGREDMAFSQQLAPTCIIKIELFYQNMIIFLEINVS